MREARKNLSDLRYECDAATIERAKLVLRHKDAVAKIRDAHRALLEAQIRHIEARSDVSGLKDRSSSIMERLDLEKQNVQEAMAEAERTRDAGRQLGTQVQELLAQHPDKSEEFSRLCENKGPEEIEMEIEAEAANLELIHAANPNVIREFERRAQEIERLSHKMAGLNQKLAGLDAQLEEIMAKWEPQLDELVAKINDAFAYNFEQISCAGEIRVHKDPDFDLWAMDIMVRFRYVFLSTTFFVSLTLTQPVQRERNTPAAHRPPPIRRRARRVHHLLPHGPPIHGAVALPRRRRDQPGHGPAQRAHGARAHGRDCLPRAHQPVFPHHPEVAHGPPLRPQDARPVYRQRRAHASRGPEAGLCEVSTGAEGADGGGIRMSRALRWYSLASDEGMGYDIRVETSNNAIPLMNIFKISMFGP